MIRRLVLFTLVITLILPACENSSMNKTAQGGLGGAAVGAGLGAIVGSQTGSAGAGVAIGSAVGALGGALIGRQVEKRDEVLAERDQRIASQEQVLEQNRRILDELRKRGADVRTTERGVVVNLPDVLYDFDSARLTPEAVRTIREIAEVLRGVQSRWISVEGHTDSTGTMAYNQQLSVDRARSAADELVAQGISRRRITTRGFGEGNPIATNSTEAGRQRNRRVEVIIEN